MWTDANVSKEPSRFRRHSHASKNTLERFDDKFSNVWLLAGSWAGDVESLDHVILQESAEPLCGILQARVKVQAWLVMLAGELDGLFGASA